MATDLLAYGAAWLSERRHRHLTRPITYRRGSRTIETRATVGRTNWEVDDGHGYLERFESRDFVVRSSDLVHDGRIWRPQAGDRITEAGSDVVYEVMSPPREPVWRNADPDGVSIRIHSKRVDS
jgi:hypothetical protein